MLIDAFIFFTNFFMRDEFTVLHLHHLKGVPNSIFLEGSWDYTQRTWAGNAAKGGDNRHKVLYCCAKNDLVSNKKSIINLE